MLGVFSVQESGHCRLTRVASGGDRTEEPLDAPLMFAIHAALKFVRVV